MTSIPERSIAVTGWGMVSALACDVEGSCAAARARIRRAQPMLDFEYITESGCEVVPTVHEIAAGFAQGFEGKGRLIRVLSAALADLAGRTGAAGQPPERAALYLSLPAPDRVCSDLDLIISQAHRKMWQEKAAETVRTPAQPWAQNIIDRAALHAKVPPLPIAHLSFSGRTGFAEALAAAARDLAARPALTTAIVGGVDSQLDTVTLTWLQDMGRLKFSENPVGIEPGEAAALVVLQKAERNRVPDQVLAWLASVIVNDAVTAEPGLSLHDALVASRTAGPPKPIDWIVSDADGTAEAAADLGHALVRLCRAGGNKNPALMYPAASFGDVGAATGAVAGCLAMAAWQRGWAPAATAFLVQSARSRRSAYVLTAPA